MPLTLHMEIAIAIQAAVLNKHLRSNTFYMIKLVFYEFILFNHKVLKPSIFLRPKWVNKIDQCFRYWFVQKNDLINEHTLVQLNQ